MNTLRTDYLFVLPAGQAQQPYYVQSARRQKGPRFMPYRGLPPLGGPTSGAKERLGRRSPVTVFDAEWPARGLEIF